jgi:FMN phosphatase YigB (HAD superfamily)
MGKTKDLLLFDIDDTLFNTEAFILSDLTKYSLYEDAEAVLKHLKGKIELGIFSQGETDFQYTKLRRTNILDFFSPEHTYIVVDKVAASYQTLHKYSETHKVFFVEDRLPTLLEVKKVVPEVTTIWIKQGRHAKTQKPIPGFTPDEEIHTLSELIPLLEHIQTK